MTSDCPISSAISGFSQEMLPAPGDAPGGCWQVRTQPLGDGGEKDEGQNVCIDVAESGLDAISDDNVVAGVGRLFPMHKQGQVPDQTLSCHVVVQASACLFTYLDELAKAWTPTLPHWKISLFHADWRMSAELPAYGLSKKRRFRGKIVFDIRPV